MGFAKPGGALRAFARGAAKRASYSVARRGIGSELATKAVKKLTIRNSNPNQVISQRYRTQLRYSENFVISTPNLVTTAVSQQFIVNSIFAPSTTATAHQPLGRDQLALLYGKYRVHGVQYEIRISPVTTASVGLIAMVQQRNDGTSLTGTAANVIIEQPFTTSRPLSSTNVTAWKGRLSSSVLAGMTKSQYEGEDGTQAAFGASPTEIQALNIALAFTVAQAPVSVAVELLLVYDVECYDPIVIGQS